MPPVNIYLDEESYEEKKKIPKGELSKIVQNAIKEHAGMEIDLDAIENKIKLITEDLKKLEYDKKFWEEKAKSMRIVEKEKSEMDKKEKKISMEKEKKEKKEMKTKTFNSLLKKILEWFVIDEKKAKKLMKSYDNYKKSSISKGENFIGWVAYFESKGVKRK